MRIRAAAAVAPCHFTGRREKGEKGEKGNELREEDLDLPLARLG
jgi:hypothetical protein